MKNSKQTHLTLRVRLNKVFSNNDSRKGIDSDSSVRGSASAAFDIEISVADGPPLHHASGVNYVIVAACAGTLRCVDGTMVAPGGQPACAPSRAVTCVSRAP